LCVGGAALAYDGADVLKQGSSLNPELAKAIVDSYQSLSTEEKSALSINAQQVMEEFRQLPPEKQRTVILQLQAITEAFRDAEQTTLPKQNN
ncbi:MAG: hypothetical protein KDD76_03280, partial [Rickettsiales bacterium]|nr:hypothetical protein [Rickettsiales bacterium]